MSDTFESTQGGADRFTEHPGPPKKELSPLVLGCGALLLAFFALGVLAVAGLGVAWFAVGPAADPASGRTVIRRGTPVAEQSLPDGSFLVIEKVTYGRQHRFEFDIEQTSQRGFPGSPSPPGGVTEQTEKDSIVVWMTKWDSTKRKALDFDWFLRCAAVDAHGCEIDNFDKGRNAYEGFGSSSTHGGTGPFSRLGGGPYDMIVTHFGLPAIRHDGKTFKLRVYDTTDQKVAEFDVPDPTPSGGSYPEWKPEPLPATKSDGDVSLTLTGLMAQSSESPRTNNGISWTETRIRLNTQFETKQADETTGAWSERSFRLFDALGNESSVWDCRLCQKESAWGLQVKVWRNDSASFDASETWSFAELPVPERQRVQYVNQAKTFERATLELLAVGGTGSVSYPGLVPGYSGGHSSSGSSYFGQGKDRRRVPYKIRVRDNQVTVESEVPHLLARVTRLSSDHRLSLRVKDDEGGEVRLSDSLAVAPAPTLRVWFIDAPQKVKSLNAEFIVHLCRTFDFLVAPPAVEPDPTGPLSRSPRTPAQRRRIAEREIQNRKRALAAAPDDLGAMNNLAWAYVTAPDELRDAKQAVTLAEKAVARKPEDRNYVNTLGAAYYQAGQYDKALSILERNARERTDAVVCFDLYALAMAYFRLHQKDKAKETYEQALDRHRGFEAKLSSTHWHELYGFRVEAATLLLGEPPQQVFDRARELARKGAWEPAAAQFAKGLDVYPDEHWQWYRSGALEAYLDHADEYRNRCRKMLELFGDTRDPYIAERTGKLCLLLPDAVPNDSRPTQLVDRAVGKRPDVSWLQLAAAIAKYRSGKFKDALEQLQTAETQAGDQVYCRTFIELFQAMSQHHLGEHDAAQKSLAKAVARLDASAPQPEDETVDYGTSWHDYLMAEVIRREAEGLLRDAPRRKPDS